MISSYFELSSLLSPFVLLLSSSSSLNYHLWYFYIMIAQIIPGSLPAPFSEYVKTFLGSSQNPRQVVAKPQAKYPLAKGDAFRRKEWVRRGKQV